MSEQPGAPGANTDIEWLTTEPMLHEPILIVMMTGWIDAAGAAAAAVQVVADECETAPMARFDDDTFIDYRARRPTMELRDGVNTKLRWNHIELLAGRSPAGRDVLVLMGPEPDMNWRRFSKAIGDIAVELGVTHMIGFGAYPFAAPHTRTPRLSCSSPSIDVLANVNFARSSVDVPAGMAAALEHTMHDRKIPALGIWAQVPHYVSSMTYPASSVALLDGLAEATGVRIAGAALRNEVGIQRERIDQMVADNVDHQLMVTQLESLHDAAVEDDADAADAAAEMRLKSGDEIAAEIQEFLRDQPDA
ncbi:PAC2 family protein [uncultured Ilumatobacter sp.]|uniref:PAC2 family protein n=1 Tax=uncultured Ilumatobacter sp. TaxID=879968 RepID=UPI00374F3CD4